MDPNDNRSRRDSYDNRSDQRSPSRIPALLGGLLLGLLLGILLGGYFGYRAYERFFDQDKSPQSQQQSQQNNRNQNDSDKQNFDPEGNTQLSAYAYGQMLAEAARESQDAPSPEASAAQSELSRASNRLAETIISQSQSGENVTPSRDDLQNRLDSFNKAYLQYATNARSEDDPNQESIDEATSELANYLKQNFHIDNSTQLDAQITSAKNTLLEVQRDFINEDYTSSYDKQREAQRELAKAFGQIKRR